MWCNCHLRPRRAIVLLVSWWTLEASRDIEAESPDGQSPDDVALHFAIANSGAFVKQHSLSNHEPDKGRHSSSDKAGLLMPVIVDDEHAHLRSTAWRGRSWRPPLPAAEPPTDDDVEDNEESPEDHDAENDADDDEEGKASGDSLTPEDHDADDDEEIGDDADNSENDAEEVYDELRAADMQAPKDLPQHHVVSSGDPLEALPLRAAFDVARPSLVQPHKVAAQLSHAELQLE